MIRELKNGWTKDLFFKRFMANPSGGRPIISVKIRIKYKCVNSFWWQNH